VRERTGHLNRIKALFERMASGRYGSRMQNGVSVGDGRPIPARLKIEIEREWKRLKVVAEQIREIEAERDRLVKGSEPANDACTVKMRRLIKLHGIGAEFATVLMREVFY
jgi:transposase